MDFSEHRRCWGRRRAARRAAWAAITVGFLAVTGLTHAAPLDEPFVGGLSFSGPTSGNVAAIYWNPAALGLTRGFQLMIAGSGRWTSTGVSRIPYDPTAHANLPPQMASARDMAQPFQWPMGPGAFIGVSSDLGGDRFALGFATYMPFLQQVHYPLSPAGDEPTRYHALDLDLRNLALVPALAIRFGNDFRVGVAPGFLFSTGRLSFAQDTALDRGPEGLAADCGGGIPCGIENPAAAARFDIMSGHGLDNAKFSVTLGGGVYFRRRSVEFGLSYQSRPLGSDVDGVEVVAPRTTVRLPPGSAGGIGAPIVCPGPQSGRCVFGDVAYRLPDVFIAGATWHIGPGLELTAMLRWLWMHVHDRIDIRLLGPTLDATGLPQHIALFRGFQDVWDARVRVSYWWRERVRVGATMRLETSGVQGYAVNPAAVDGLKIEPILLAEVRIGRRLWIGGGYGVTLMPAVTVTDSAFNPTFATDCANAGGNLNELSCQARLVGRARPSANGRYTAMAQDFGLTLTARF